MSDKEEDVDTNANKNEVNDIDHLSRDQLPISSSSSNFTSSASIDTHDCNFIERITPKVLFVGSSLKVGPNQFIQKDLPVFMRQELGMVPPPGVKNKGMKLEQTGLDKFRKYIESNRTYPEMKLGERVSRQLSGQEKIANVSVTIGCLKNEQKKMTSRPPVLGHASSSSNDSGSVISGSSGNESEDVPVSVSAVGTDNEFVYTDVKLAVLSNREDYISVKPPEGSSDQSSLSLQQEQPPSSASSVASVSLKPLEWDSGADVGYYQIYSSNNNDDKKLSTIERIAIATGSAALLTRLEPEGTAEYLSQLANTIPSNKSLKKGNIKDRLGLPIAESTPFSTNQLNADTPLGLHATSGSEDELSPITAAASSEHLCAQTAINEDAYHELNELARQMPSYEKLPRPLFPDIKPRNPSPSAGSSQSSQKNKPISSYFTPLQEDIDKVPENSEQQENLDTESINTGALKGNLRKHCSMENLRDNELPISPPTINLFNTLPRSHSHSNVCVALPESNTLPKYLLQSHNPTKSASSSSISTVVQKRKDSPKHISKLVQTSFVNQSIGVQATESSRSSQKSRSQSRERSQSLKAESNPLSGPSSITGFSIQNFQCSKPSLVSPLHRHNGNVCTGAHRKVFDRGEVSKRHTSRSNYARTSKDESNVGSNSSDQQKGGKVNMADGKESRIDNNDESGTLDSVTSSARTDHHAWADRRESIGVEDRANSFEYLPGHMYETVARPDDASGESSSISLNRNASSQNEVSDEAEKSWDLSNSSTLARDIERGVDMMLNFVQSSQVKSSELKKKLIKRVAEKLISNDIASGGHKLDSKNQSSVGSHSLSEDGLGEHINGRETRRSLVKDIPCQESPFTSERTSSRTSSECFKPKSSFSSANKFMKDAHDKCVGTEFTTQSQSDSNEPRRTVGSVGVQCESISSNEVSKLYLEKSSGKYHDKKESRDLKKQQTVNGEKKRQAALERRFKTTESSATIDSNRSSSVDHSTDWRPAMPIPTNVFEQKRKHQGNARRAMPDNGNSKAMIDLLSVERDNQRIMIQSEIEHLDYLRRLLRKQEELRDSLARIQKTRKKHLESRYNRCKTANESNKQMLNSIKSRLEQYSKSHHKRNSYTIEEHQEWDSHHYYSSTDEMNKPVSKKVHGSNSISRNQQPGENNDPVANKLEDSGRVNNSHPSKERENRTAVKSNDEVIESDEIPATDGNQQPVVSQPRKSSKSSISGQSGPEKAVCNCKKKQSCKCFRNNQSLEKNKKPLAYFITFEDGSSGNNSNVGTDTSMEEVKMKSNKSHDKSSTGTNLKKKELTIEKENREPKHFRKQNECRPTLQEYLLMNRGEYVNRAEYRRKCVAELTYLRELRNKTKRHLIVMAPESSDYSQSTTPRELPPPPLAMKRVFSQKTMRRQTERKYRKLAEVQNRHIDMKRKEAYRTNRLMAEVFTKKLQKRVLNGETNLSNSVSVISSL